MRIESLRVQNYKVLRDVTLSNVSPLTVLLGANGSGKSTLLDVFAFLRDCVRYGVNEAVFRRDGFHELRSRDVSGMVEVEIRLRLADDQPSLVYELVLDGIGDDAFVFRESLTRHSDQETPITLFQFNVGIGEVRTDFEGGTQGKDSGVEVQQMESTNVLALRGLGQTNRYSTVSALRRAIEGWHFSTLSPGKSDQANEFHSARYLAPDASNVEEIAWNIQHAHPERFKEVVRRFRRLVPGLKDVEPYMTDDRRLVLHFQDGSIGRPFLTHAVSEGTRKLFALLLMLNEPQIHPLLTVEEPENDLYPQIVRPLAEEFRAYANRGSQVFISTHSPDFVNALDLNELYWIEKRGGFAHVVRAQDDSTLVAQHVEGELLGALWREGFFGKVDPL